MVLNCLCSGKKKAIYLDLSSCLTIIIFALFSCKKLVTKYKTDGGLFFQKITCNIDKHVVMSLRIEDYFTSMMCLKKFTLWRPYNLLPHLWVVLCLYKWIHPSFLSTTVLFILVFFSYGLIWKEINHPLILHKGNVAMTDLKIQVWSYAVGILTLNRGELSLIV